MRVKLLTTISFFTYQLSISQTDKILNGKVLSETILLKNVEVINKTSKISTTTNDMGQFSISAKVKDSLILFSEGYYFKRLKLTQYDLDNNNLIFNMIILPLELNEVVVSNKSIKTVWLTKEEIKKIKLNAHKTKEELEISGYKKAKNGPLDVDFVYLGKQLYNLVKKEKKIKTRSPEMDLKKWITNSVPETFFSKELKINTEEKELFLEFCDIDPKCKNLLDNDNILKTMDFLFAKNKEFQKLKKDLNN